MGRDDLEQIGLKIKHINEKLNYSKRAVKILEDRAA